MTVTPPKPAVARQIVDDGRFVGVIGHDLSTTSEAAAPVYQGGGDPHITPFATADTVTRDRPWYFPDRVRQHRTRYHRHGELHSSRRRADPNRFGVDGRQLRGFTRSGVIKGLESFKKATLVDDIVVSDDPAERAAGLRAAADQVAEIKDVGATFCR